MLVNNTGLFGSKGHAGRATEAVHIFVPIQQASHRSWESVSYGCGLAACTRCMS